MPILKNCEIYFPKLVPARPNKRYNKENPTWETQIRTTSKDTKKQWEALGLQVRAVIPDEDGAQPYYRANLRRRTIKADGTPSDPVEVLNGKLEPLDPATIGNGTVANVRVFQYPYGDEGKVANVLMAVQVTKHVVYTPPAGAGNYDESFEECETEVIESQEDAQEGDDSGDDGDDTPPFPTEKKAPASAPKPSSTAADDY